MSTEIAEIKNTGRNGSDLTLTQFSGGTKGVMLQVTQGPGTIISYNTPGFIQLKRDDACALMYELKCWLEETK